MIKFSLPSRFLSTAVALGVATLLANATHAATSYEEGDYLVKLAPSASLNTLSRFASDAKLDKLGGGWVHVKAKNASRWSPRSLEALQNNPDVVAIQPNYKIHLLNDYKVTDQAMRARIMDAAAKGLITNDANKDNPDIPAAPGRSVGVDPLFSNQWGMLDIGVREVGIVPGKEVVVAVIDTGVDYTHEDLVGSMWRNPGEMGNDARGMDRAVNQLDDDGNGYVDDIVGWDFVSNDNKPYDLAAGMLDMILGGGNPGHGTHCAGNVGAATQNGKGIRGAGQNVKIMAVRFLSDKGQGTTADAIKAIRYAVANHAQVLSNSWGSEGEDPADGENNQALRDVISYAQSKGILFVAAAGNGHSGVGYDNDTDPQPGYPASYENDNIVSVAAIDVNNNLGSFSNWGLKSVDIAAPGVNIYSTMVNNQYNNKVIDIPFIGLTANWDGTSMATPHVAGAAALYLSTHPGKTWKDAKDALIESAVKVPQLAGRVVSGGKLNLISLLAHQ
jgi:subtilisin family serine protease